MLGTVILIVLLNVLVSFVVSRIVVGWAMTEVAEIMMKAIFSTARKVETQQLSPSKPEGGE